MLAGGNQRIPPPIDAGFFLAAPDFSNGTFRVACRAGDNTLQPPDWSRVLKVRMWCRLCACTCCNQVLACTMALKQILLAVLPQHAPRACSVLPQDCHVLVMTPQTFLNALDSGHAHCDDLALLVSQPLHCW